MKILCFAPHSAIWLHAFPEALVAESLQQSGHEIIYVTCGGVFDKICVSMGAFGVGHEADPKRKKEICKTCTRHADTLRSEFKFGGFDLASLLVEEDRAWVADTLSRVSRENFLTVIEDGIELGRIALSNLLMGHKKSDLEFSEPDWQRYLAELENTLLAFVGCRKIFDRDKPDRVVVYNAAYSVNLVCCELARQRGVPHYLVTAGGNLSNRLQRLILARGHSVDFHRNNIAHWPTYRHRPCTDYEIRYIVDHMLVLFRGGSGFAYSQPSVERTVDFFEQFGIRREQKVLLATTSSYDEIFASQITGLWPAEQRIVFPRLLDWLRALLAYMEERPELFLIIRIHPREFPNRRDGKKSDHARQLEELLSHLPKNVRVNWPNEGISLYDLAAITDVCLNAWSSAGKELSLLGIPMVSYAPDLMTCPDDLNYLASSPDTYFAQVDKALRDGWSIERSRLMFRWYALEYHKSLLDLSQSYAYREGIARSFFERVIQRLRRIVSPAYLQVSDCRNRAAKLPQQSLINELLTSGKTSILDLAPEYPTATIEEETQSLRKGVRRLLLALYGDDNTNWHEYGGLRRQLAAFAGAGPVVQPNR